MSIKSDWHINTATTGAYRQRLRTLQTYYFHADDSIELPYTKNYLISTISQHFIKFSTGTGLIRKFAAISSVGKTKLYLLPCYPLSSNVVDHINMLRLTATQLHARATLLPPNCRKKSKPCRKSPIHARSPSKALSKLFFKCVVKTNPNPSFDRTSSPSHATTCYLLLPHATSTLMSYQTQTRPSIYYHNL
jgi:hypothetical protein